MDIHKFLLTQYQFLLPNSILIPSSPLMESLCDNKFRCLSLTIEGNLENLSSQVFYTGEWLGSRQSLCDVESSESNTRAKEIKSHGYQWRYSIASSSSCYKPSFMVSAS